MHLTQSGMNIMSNTICAFPWVHMSADQQGEMIICCNTYEKLLLKIMKVKFGDCKISLYTHAG